MAGGGQSLAGKASATASKTTAAGMASGMEEVFYRAMSKAEYAAMEEAGGLTFKSGTELFVSTSEQYSRGYLLKRPENYHVLVKFEMKPGAMEHFKQRGVTHRKPGAEKGWAARGKLLFKREGGALNVGVQNNTHVFNAWIKNFKIIP